MQNKCSGFEPTNGFQSWLSVPWTICPCWHWHWREMVKQVWRWYFQSVAFCLSKIRQWKFKTHLLLLVCEEPSPKESFIHNFSSSSLPSKPICSGAAAAPFLIGICIHTILDFFKVSLFYYFLVVMYGLLPKKWENSQIRILMSSKYEEGKVRLNS